MNAPAILKNGSFRGLFFDLAKMAIIALLALVFAFWQSANATSDLGRSTCRSLQLIRANQKLVITDLIAVAITLEDRTNVGLSPLPPATIQSLIDALANLPDETTC